MKVSHADITNVGLSKNGHNASVVKSQVVSEPEGRNVDSENIKKQQQVADFSAPVAAMKGQKASGRKNTKGISIKADKVTVTPPANAEVEYWNITSTYYYYNNGWQSINFGDYFPYVSVAIDGNDIYIAGLCTQLPEAWVKGTINGNTVTFPSPQFYGSVTEDGETYDFWFVGENSNAQQQNSVTFSYNATIGQLTLTTSHIATKDDADEEIGSWYGWHQGMTITRPRDKDPEFTVCSGSATNGYVPVYGFYVDTRGCESQMIYPAATITGAGLQAGDKINAITFYVTEAQGTVPSQIGTATVQVRIGETTATTIGSTNAMTNNRNGKQTVFTGNLPTGDYKMTITFNQPYTYNGGNLLIDTYVSVKGSSYASCNWEGISAASGSSYYYGNSYYYGAQAFLPKMSIDFTAPAIETGLDVVVKDEDFFQGISYDCTDSEGTHTSYLNQVATKPEQMIAMIQKVYTDPTIPGNFKRGFSSKGRNEPYNDVAYTGVGTIVHDGTTSFNSASHYSWADGYGWGITGNTGNTNHTEYGYNSLFSTHYSYMDSTKYKPEKNGLTLLLVEIKDDYNLVNYLNKIYSTTYSSTYEKLKAQLSESVKSIRVISSAKRTGDGVDKGTLFKIDCNKMNIFFLIAKGQMRYPFNSQRVFANFSDQNNTRYYPGATFSRLPLYAKSDDSSLHFDGDETNTTGGFIDYNTGELFYHMFEQFSPYDLATHGDNDDLYALMVSDDMETFGVKHDCVTVPMASPAGHHFMMYGENSPAADCQDVRDLMFFIPDYRMMYHKDRDVNAKFLNYHPQHLPTMGMYVIRQDEITPTTKADEYYMLQLNWRSNLDDFLPSDEQEFELLQVVVDEETGEQKYVPVYYLDENGNYIDAAGNPSERPVPIILVMEAGRVKNYPYVYVKRETSSQQVTYAIRGRDAADENGQHFLSLQISNSMSYIVPGTDPSEIVFLNDATHYSRFDAQRVRNCYSNKLTLENNVDGIKQDNLTSETKLTITRIPQGGNVEAAEIATVTFNPSNKTYTVQMAAQAADETEFPECKDGSRAGYHANNGSIKGNGSWTGDYTVSTTTDVIDLGTLEIFDNFVQAIPDNNYHPIGYVYQVTSNYACDDVTPTSVYLNATACTTGDEVWYAWTWNDNTDGKWLQAIAEGGLLKFGPVKNNIIFARMNPAASNVPSFGETTWNQTGDLSVAGYEGKTFTISWGYNGAINGYWGSDVIPETAHSNTFRIPIYKTSSQINGVFSKDDVDGDTDGTLGVPENVEFGVGVQLSSKTEILRYDTYRWNEQEPRYSVASANGDDEQDLPPTGQAMNQGEYYTISMNPDTSNETNGETSVSSGTGTATFVDKVPGESEDAVAYIYAPIVEVMSGRGDYNSYGGPLQSAAVGKLDVERDTRPKLMSTYNWTNNGKKYAYYNINMQVNTKDVPAGYEIYKVRAWRTVSPAILGEEYADQSQAIADRMGDENGKFMFEEINFDSDAMYAFNHGYVLGSDDASAQVTGANGTSNTIEFTIGTFGAQKLRTNELEGDNSVIDELNATFVVRLYYTRAANLAAASGAPMLKDVATDADGKYYIVEQVIPFQQKGGDVPTAVQNLDARQPVSVKYYNAAGVESDKPFQGVNIVVTRYSDGSTTTTKILK